MPLYRFGFDAMAGANELQLWADDGSLTVGAVVYNGQDGVRDFFANTSGAFKHYWVSLAPAFKTQFDIHGNTANIYFECHYADPSVTPYVLKSDVSATGGAELRSSGPCVEFVTPLGTYLLSAGGDIPSRWLDHATEQARGQRRMLPTAPFPIVAIANDHPFQAPRTVVERDRRRLDIHIPKLVVRITVGMNWMTVSRVA